MRGLSWQEMVRLAGSCLAASVVSLLYVIGDLRLRSAMPSIPYPNTEAVEHQQQIGRRVTDSMLLAAVARAPFDPMRGRSESDEGDKIEDNTEAGAAEDSPLDVSESSMPFFRLKGLAAWPGGGIAVIQPSQSEALLLSIGETIEQYRVLAIEAHHVLLARGDQMITIPVDQFSLDAGTFREAELRRAAAYFLQTAPDRNEVDVTVQGDRAILSYPDGLKVGLRVDENGGVSTRRISELPTVRGRRP